MKRCVFCRRGLEFDKLFPDLVFNEKGVCRDCYEELEILAGRR